MSLWNPHTIISDNGTNFASKQVVSFCTKYNIAHRFSSPYYPQGNGQAEINNHTIFDSLCKFLDKAKGKWVEKFSLVLWAYMTTKHVSTEKTPFSLAYGAEATIPTDINMPTLRVEGVVPDQNDTLPQLMLDHSEERCQQAQIRIIAYQQQIWVSHNKKPRPKEFQVRDLVLKRVI